MDCPRCGTRLVVFDVPAAYREYVPDDDSRAGLCPTCLSLHPAGGVEPTGAGFDRVGAAFPTNREAAVPLALALGLLESLALNRAAIESLLEAVEAAGTDPLLVLDRLAAQGSTRPSFDLDRRRHQIQQLLG